ncbi:hypothetical protein NEOLI_004072 [Neolecta irregularis DAH-3]|uniref:Vacuolar protein sorting-associated protein 9a n=1 Tax=Neolecta irregularis (strain DAH-3) TaxID=1198029 RepID=A0A1U7LTP7_NEOID|nr:hypothetical protein NEOLI_004072 [Neolecta irregularis DAH-3]|eukprot:OLL26046.1 hypothetical protein NEOLI_004072 [Neolecta irregularis DAH-3]
MALCSVWASALPPEFDNAKEGMEKLVMNRLYNTTFPPVSAPANNDDLHKDIVLKQKIDILSWISEDHLEIPKTDLNDRFLSLAKQELLKINSYRAPRDKIICILNCCKVIFGLLRHAGKDESADIFIPTLIFVVLRANPENLVSNLQYIYRFRNLEKLKGEAEYYLSSLMGAISFIENLDRSSLSISQEDFDRNVETSLSLLHLQQQPRPPTPAKSLLIPTKEFLSKSSNALKENISRPLGQLTRLLSDENLPNLIRQSSSKDSISEKPLPSINTSTPPTTSPFPPRLDSLSTHKYSASSEINRPPSSGKNIYPGAPLHQSRLTFDQKNTMHELSFMFPEFNREVIEAVYHNEAGKIDNVVDVLLNMS